MHFYQLMLRVRDIEKSLAFYRNFVGLKVLNRLKSDEWEVAFLADKECATQIELICIKRASKWKRRGLRYASRLRTWMRYIKGAGRRAEPLGHP